MPKKRTNRVSKDKKKIEVLFSANDFIKNTIDSLGFSEAFQVIQTMHVAMLMAIDLDEEELSDNMDNFCDLYYTTKDQIDKAKLLIN